MLLGQSTFKSLNNYAQSCQNRINGSHLNCQHIYITLVYLEHFALQLFYHTCSREQVYLKYMRNTCSREQVCLSYIYHTCSREQVFRKYLRYTCSREQVW
jgi:hypothetical protein